MLLTISWLVGEAVDINLQQEELEGERTILGNMVKAIDPEMGGKLTDPQRIY
jgi:hypothetical protein